MDNTNIQGSTSKLEKFASAFSGLVQKDFIIQEIKLSIHQCDDLADALFQACEMRARTKILITSDDLKKFFHLLLMSRVSFARHGLGLASKKIHVIHPKLVQYPAILFPILTSLGVVIDTEKAIKFVPVLDEPEGGIDLKEYCDVNKVITFLQSMQDIGLELATAMPTEIFGSFAYTMMVSAQDTLVSHTAKVIPSDVVIAAILKVAKYDAIVRYPFTYGSITEYASIDYQYANTAFMGERYATC